MKTKPHLFWIASILAFLHIAQGALALGSAGPCASHLEPESCCCHHGEIEGNFCCENNNQDANDACGCILEPGKPIQSHLPNEGSQIKASHSVATAPSSELLWKPMHAARCGKVSKKEKRPPQAPPIRILHQTFLI